MTTTPNLATIRQSFVRVFKRPAYILLAGFSALISCASMVWLPNIPLLVALGGTDSITTHELLVVAIGLLDALFEGMTLISAGLLVAISLLFGVYVSMTTFFIRRRIAASGGGSLLGVLGITVGAIGAGCAACGAAGLSVVLSLFGVAGAVTLFPFGGVELGAIAVVILAWSIAIVAKKIATPNVCAA